MQDGARAMKLAERCDLRHRLANGIGLHRSGGLPRRQPENVEARAVLVAPSVHFQGDVPLRIFGHSMRDHAGLTRFANRRTTMPPAARITDNHTCPMADPKPHVGGPIVSGEPTVLIGFMPAARKTDALICTGIFDTISKGEPTVLIGYREAARLGDKTHVGVIVQGCPTVLIGSDNVAPCLQDAAETGMPFVTQAKKP
ncbi:MAG: PAAR domain-containing protein [Polyangiaceae bacterium]|nr:PAAR domain-containing protein [Polyangiaceae bacterium]